MIFRKLDFWRFGTLVRAGTRKKKTSNKRQQVINDSKFWMTARSIFNWPRAVQFSIGSFAGFLDFFLSFGMHLVFCSCCCFYCSLAWSPGLITWLGPLGHLAWSPGFHPWENTKILYGKSYSLLKKTPRLYVVEATPLVGKHKGSVW